MRRLLSLPRSTLMASNRRATGASPAIAGEEDREDRSDISGCDVGIRCTAPVWRIGAEGRSFVAWK